ncbi:MAG: cellulose biosynthesis cyclic di-GMP-binding regulatory protein BcsB, partial [Planctomycetota bacterium]
MLAHVALLLLANPSPASPSPAPVRREEIGFAERLGLRDLELRGERISQHVDFFCEAGWAPASGSELRLFFEHSPDLDAERAFLAISLNHGILRSVRLGGNEVAPTELIVPLPEAMLKPTNQLVFSVEQPLARKAGLAWTRILARSRISLLLARRPVAWSLADLPAPLLQRWSHAPRRLTVLLPSRPSLETTEATAVAVANLCRRVAPEPVSLVFVRSPADAASPVLAVGTPSEQPELRRLALPSPLSLREGPGGAMLAHGGRPLEPSLGTIALAKLDATPVLLVSGNTPEAVRKAGRSLLSAPRRNGDRVLRVAQEARGPGSEPRRWKGYLPPSSRSTLSELSDDETELAVTRDTPARVKVRALPDARFLPYGHSLKLAFQALPALGQDPDAALEVYWNDALIRQAPVRSLGAGPSFSLSLRLPSAALLAENVLTVSWNGRSGAPGPFVMLRGESELNLPREHAAQLPDLSRLRTGLYPLGLRADLADTVLVPPARAGEEGLAALAELAALLGRLLPTDQLAFRVRDATGLGAVRASAHLVLLE